MRFEQAGDYIINELKKELPDDLIYHNIEHTCDVYLAAENIGRQENISADDMTLLLTAALYHDSGFLVRATGHEEESCRIAEIMLPVFDYTEHQVNIICGMIRATRVPQSPKTLLERILVDADLDYLGRDDFFEIGHRLYNELSLTGALGSETDWNTMQLDFIENHAYFTQSAINLRQAKKEANIAAIRALLLKQNTR